MEYISLYMFLAVCLLLMLGYPVALTLAGTALGFAAAGIIAGQRLDPLQTHSYPLFYNRSFDHHKVKKSINS